jgi:hypothetical protein
VEEVGVGNERMGTIGHWSFSIFPFEVAVEPVTSQSSKKDTYEEMENGKNDK